MTNKNMVGVGFLALAISVLPLTTASAQPITDRKVACESKGHKWNSETGRCIKSLKKPRCIEGYYPDPETYKCNPLYQDKKIIFF
jgi:hypothetical protein